MAARLPSNSATQEKSVSLLGIANHSCRKASGSTLVRIMNRLTSGSLRKDNSSSMSVALASRSSSEPDRAGHGVGITAT